MQWRRRAGGARGATRRRAKYRVLRWIFGSLFAFAVVVGVVAGLRLAQVSHDLTSAKGLLLNAGDQIEQGQLGSARQTLDDAQRLLTRSNNVLFNDPFVSIASTFPVLSQNLGSLRDTVGLALRMTDGGGRILAISRPLEDPSGKLEVPLDGGAIPLEAVRQAQVATSQLADVLPRSDAKPGTGLLFGPVRDAQAEIYKQAGRRRDQLDAVGRGLRLLEGLSGADGSKRYLIAVANPAEMRGAGGMVLSYGVLEASRGTFTLGDFGNIDELELGEPFDPRVVGDVLPQDYLSRWAGLEPTKLWRNTTLNPDLSFDAPVMEGMFTARTGLSVDGVIQIDPAGLAAILAGTGPVQVEGLGQVDSTNIVDLVLNKAYIDFPNRDQRQELLGDVARAAFRALIDGKFKSLRPLATALFEAAQQRHLALYDSDSSIQRTAASFGATAEIPPADTQDYALLTVQNFSRNKLDYYLDSSLQLTGSRPGGAPGALTATVTLANTAPADGSASYVFGPNFREEKRGLYRGVVSLYLPLGVSLESSTGDGATAPPSITSEAGRAVATFSVEIPAGETRTVTMQLALAPRRTGAYSLTVVPVPRVRPTVVSVDIDAQKDGRVTRAAGPLLKQEILR
ncbi:MAG: DUF4012 domain-containing protein [Acidimicrobiales bacterium]